MFYQRYAAITVALLMVLPATGCENQHVAAAPDQAAEVAQLDVVDPCAGFDTAAMPPRKTWPSELRECIDGLAKPPTCLEVRYADPKSLSQNACGT